jgi:aminopeptidase N
MFYLGTDGDPGGMEQRTALLSHELAHQWFPDMIRMNDGYGAWLSEGWSEFSSIDFLSTLHDPGWANGMFSYYGLLYQYAIEPWDDYGLTSKESVQVSNPWAYQIITYYKGATVTATLRSVLGEEVFYKAVRQLYSDLAGKDETYETKDLQKYFEDASGQDLQWLFDEWVYRTGFPIYTVGVSRGTTAEGRSKATVTIGRGTSVTGHDFRMPVKLRLVTNAGDQDHVEILDQAQSTFTWEHDGRLVRVQVDPDQTFIRRLLPALPGDLDLSGEVDGIDLIYVSWAQDSSFFHGWNFLPYADMDGSGTVGSEDLQAVTNAFGANSDEVQP